MATLKQDVNRSQGCLGDGAAKSHIQANDREVRKAAGCRMPNQQADRVELKP